MPYGNPDPTHPIKLVKGLQSPPNVQLTAQQAGRFFFKLIYEFWGFCVNGASSLTVPGGLVSSGMALPSGFESGSAVLLGAGNDGTTDFGGANFSSQQVNFSEISALQPSGSTLVGKYLVTWKPDDPSPDDSIYRITGVQDASHILVDVSTGGTTRLGGKAYFSARSNIRFRVVDFVSASQLTGWTTSGVLSQSIILNLDAAPNVNPAQLVPQVKLDLTSSQAVFRMTVSPSGSWTGTTFTDASTQLSQSWFSSGSAGVGSFVVLGGRDFLITNFAGTGGAWLSTSRKPGFHIEVPQRLYPPQNDPNPVAWFMWTNSGGSDGLSPTTGSLASGFKMVCQDGTTRDWITMTRCPLPGGDRVNYAITPASGGLWYGISRTNTPYARAHFNSFSGSYLTTDAVLMQSGSSANAQYSLSRVRLRRVRFTGRNTPPYLRLGERWVHIGGGVLWPWDGSERPYGIFWMGAGAIPGGIEG